MFVKYFEIIYIEVGCSEFIENIFFEKKVPK